MGTNVPKSDGDNGPEDPAGDDDAGGSKNHNEIIPDDTDPREYTKLVNQTLTTSTTDSAMNMKAGHVGKMIHHGAFAK